MLKQLILYTKVNIFKSSKFYYSILWVLISFSIIRNAINRFTFIYTSDPIILPREINGLIIFVFTFCSIISAWVLRKKIDKKVLIFISAIGIISIINEIRFAFTSIDYNILESATKGQLSYVVKVLLPFFFIGLWHVLDVHKKRSYDFVTITEKLFIFNAILIIVGGVFFGFAILESYPLSGRWGYCGILLDRSVTQMVYGLLLLHNWSAKKQFNWKNLLFIVCLLISGQKAGFLWVGAFLFLVVFKKTVDRLVLFIIGLIFVIILSIYFNKVISLSSFWNGVLQEHGILGLLFSTRNNALFEVWENVINKGVWFDYFFGGINRYPQVIEMLPFDILSYFGIVGLMFFIWFFVSWVPSWKWGIPLIIAIFSGGIIGYPLAALIYFIYIYLNKRPKINTTP